MLNGISKCHITLGAIKHVSIFQPLIPLQHISYLIKMVSDDSVSPKGLDIVVHLGCIPQTGSNSFK